MTANKTIGYFIPHCEEPGCVLGRFEFKCPCCDKTVVDYDVWWKEDNISAGTPESFNCDECEEKLIVAWNKEKREYIIDNL